MPSATRVRDWATVRLLRDPRGRRRRAGADEVTRAFRELAKRSHPDATDDAEAAAALQRHHGRVRRCSATATCAGTTTEVRAQSGGRTATRAFLAPVRPAAMPKARKPWSRDRSRPSCWRSACSSRCSASARPCSPGRCTSTTRGSGRASCRSSPTRADGTGGSVVTFVTRTGERVQAPTPRQHGDPSGLGADRERPLRPGRPRARDRRRGHVRPRHHASRSSR